MKENSTSKRVEFRGSFGAMKIYVDYIILEKGLAYRHLAHAFILSVSAQSCIRHSILKPTPGIQGIQVMASQRL